jgi:hypothetical protein
MKSRWDALKPQRREEQEAPRQRPQAAPSSPPRRSNEEIRSTYARLVHVYEENTEESDSSRRLQEIASLVQQEAHGEALGGDILSSAVRDIFLPYLEKTLPFSSSRSAVGATTADATATLGAIQAALANETVVSTLLAPTVEEVDPDGAAHPRENPVGIRLLQWLRTALQQHAVSPVEVLDCLATLLRSMGRVHGGKRGSVGSSSSQALAVDPRRLYQILEDCWRPEGKSANDHPTRVLSVLQLLQTLVEQQPEASSTLLSHILVSSPSTALASVTRVCPHCGVVPSSVSMWLAALHDSNQHSDQVKAILIQCTDFLLKKAPLSVWIPPEDHRPTRSNNVSSFRERIHAGLLVLLDIGVCRLRQLSISSSTTMVDNTKLTIALLRFPPYANSSELLRRGTAFAGDLMKICWSVNISTHAPHQAMWVDALAPLMGGQTTPQGQLTVMSLPLRMWLLSPEGKNLVLDLLTERVEQEGGDRQALFFRQAAKSLPQMFLQDHKIWTALLSFSDWMDGKGSAAGATVVEALLEGRRDCTDVGISVDSSEVSRAVGSRLPKWLKSLDTDLVRSALASYSYLSPNDWSGLRVWRFHVDPIVQLCSDTQSGQKIRSEACKSLGDVCTNLVPVMSSPDGVDPTADLKSLLDEICGALLKSLDANKNVAYKAAFGLGNMAQVLSQPSSPCIVDTNLLEEVSNAVVERLDRDDPKLVSNVIRAASHMICLLGLECYADDQVRFVGSSEKVLESLANRIQEALALAQGHLSHLSWKQRSAVKKLGWGACNALTTIFSGLGDSVCALPTNSAHVCLENLCTCLIHGEILYDKTVVAAMTALNSVDPSYLGQALNGKAVFTQALGALVNGLPKFQQDKSKLDMIRNGTLKGLLDICSIADACHVLDGLAAAAALGHFYEWLILQDTSAEVFGRLALAIQRCVAVDVYWEHKFASRAQLLLQPEITDEL